MKWEEYKQLSPEDREEWNFRFKNKLERPLPSITLFVAIYSLIVMQIIVSLAIYAIPSLEPLLPQADKILSATTQLVGVSLAVVIGSYVIEYSTYFYQKNKENKWKKNRLV